ncbi:uncharacterized protein AB9W97_008081 [Spinachia spinachia]
MDQQPVACRHLLGFSRLFIITLSPNVPLSLHSPRLRLPAVALAFTARSQQLSSLPARGTGDRLRGKWEITLNGCSGYLFSTQVTMAIYQVRGSGRKEPITRGVSRGAVGEEEDLDPALDREKPEISGNVWERPKENIRRPSTIPVCPKVFPTTPSACGGSLKGRGVMCDSATQRAPTGTGSGTWMLPLLSSSTEATPPISEHSF